MRLAYVTEHLPERDELEPCALDVEGVAAVAREHEVVVFVDHASAAADQFRDSGVAVHVSEKRALKRSDGTKTLPDETRAAHLSELHAARPFDLTLYGSEQLAIRPLDGVPHGVVFGRGPVEQASLISSAGGAMRAHGRQLWASTGPVAAADLVVCDAPLDAFGLRSGSLPPRFAVRPPLPLAAGVPSDATSVAVVATGLDRLGYGSLLARIDQHLDLTPSVTVLVVYRPGVIDVAELLRAGCPPHLEKQVVLVPAGKDASAAAFLRATDVIVCASAAALAIPAVTSAGRDRPVLVLEGECAEAPLLFEHPLPSTRDCGETVVVPVAGAPDRLGQMLDEVEARTGADAVVVHHPAVADVADRLAKHPATGAVDLVAVSSPTPPLGAPSVDLVSRKVLGVRRRLWSRLGWLASQVGSVEELVVRALALDGAEPTTLFVAADMSADGEPIDDPHSADSEVWTTTVGMLPRPVVARPAPEETARQPAPPGAPADTTSQDSSSRSRSEEAPSKEQSQAVARPARVSAGRGDGAGGVPTGEQTVRQWARQHHWRDRVRLARPWRLGLRQVLEDEHLDLPPDVVEWARSHRWVDRMRIALPWRRGLLPRAMKGRW